ncbi:hypothetical protein GEMRC1_005217 [Eukaryota sp. GEM-RC1]
MLGLLKVFSTSASRLSALPAIAHKLLYHFDSELETLHKVITSTTDKNDAYTIIESMSVKQQGEFPPGEPNVPDLIKKIKRCAQTSDKHRIINSDVFSASNVILTTEECIAILDTLERVQRGEDQELEDRIKAFETLSANIPSFTVSDVCELLRIVAQEHKLKVVEICSQKLVYALPFDCEIIYNALVRGRAKTRARQIISTQMATVPDQDYASHHPTLDMLFEAFGHCPTEANIVYRHSFHNSDDEESSDYDESSDNEDGKGPCYVNDVEAPEKVNILNSWLASVPNPRFTFEEVVKLLGDFEDDAEDKVKLGNRLEVLEIVHGIMESPLSVDQVKELLQLYTNHQRRLDALIIVVEKMVFQTLWQLEEIVRMFKTSTHRKKVRSVLESVKCNQQPIDQPPKKSESVGQSDMVPYLISQFFTEGVSDSELFSRLASHVSSLSDFALTSKTFKMIVCFFWKDEEVLKVIELLSRYIQTITVDLLVFLLGQLDHAANDEKLRAVELCAEKLVYEDLCERDLLHECFIYKAGEKAIEIIESHRTTDVPRKKVPVPTIKELMEAIKEATDSQEQLMIVTVWTASVPNPVICVNDFEELLEHFPTEKDTVTSILGDATYFRNNCPLPDVIKRIRNYHIISSDERIVTIGKFVLAERNLLFTPWDLAVLCSCFSKIEGKVELIELCAPHLEYDHLSDCEVIDKCISSKENKATVKKLLKSSQDSSALKTFVENWDKDSDQFWNMSNDDLRFRYMELTEDQFWAWLKTFHFDEMRERAYQLLITKIIPPPSWA